jgi:glycerophosphoryl diester phosphodiesterase
VKVPARGLPDLGDLRLEAPPGLTTAPLWEERAPASPGLRQLEQLRALAKRVGYPHPVVLSPRNVLLDHGMGQSVSTPETGLIAAALNIDDLQRAGSPVVPWTVDDKNEMLFLLARGVKGLISDSPDILRQAVVEYSRAHAGVYLDQDGLIDDSLFTAQAHRGGANLRPENTLPAMEAGLDSLVNTLETDVGITRDGVAVLSHEHRIDSRNARHADGSGYSKENEQLIKDLSYEEIRARFILDKPLPNRPRQTNDRAASPVTVAFAQARHLEDPYLMPTVEQLFDFTRFYAEYYQTGPGKSAPEATLRWKNAQRIQLNLEPKAGSASEEKGETLSVVEITRRLAEHVLEDQVKVHCFDPRSIQYIIEHHPKIRTALLIKG